MSQEISISKSRIEPSEVSGGQVRISDQPEDPEWDTFLAETQGGHHVQTSLWGQVKALLGYQAVRVTIAQNQRAIASGAQILVRSLPPLGKVGYVSKGPVIAASDPALEELTIQELLRAAKRLRIGCLIVQPPNNGEAIARRLVQHGFQPVNINLAPTVTILIDLHKDLEKILAEMQTSTRYNIRLAKRKGMMVRQGTEQDLGVFYELLQITSQRQNFPIYPASYYQKLWEMFRPHGMIQLFIVEFEGEIVSARLSIAFGDTAINKLSAWSGKHGKFRPNEALNWAAIEWAKENGYHYYDLEGVNADAVREHQESADPEERSKPVGHSVSAYKMGFGGELVYYPGSYLYFSNPMLRAAYNRFYPMVANTVMLRKVARFIRTR